MAAISEQSVSGAIPSVAYAGFWARFAAYSIDSAIIMILFLVISIGASFAGEAVVVLGAVALFFINLLYFPVMESSVRQATLGKSLVGIKVTDLNGKRLSFRQALLRTIAKILSAIPLSIGFLLAAFTKRKQALHDMLAKCLVVRTGPSHLFKVIAMAAGGLVIMVGSGGAYFYYVYLPQMEKEISGAMQQAAKDTSTAPKPQVAKEPSPVSAASKPGSADADFNSLLGPALTGFEKPGTTRAGPAVLELAQVDSKAVWIKLHLPLIKGIDVVAPAPEITVSSILDASGKNFYDSTNSFEGGMFLKATLGRDSNPAPHFSGSRSVQMKPGLSEQSLQKIEGQVRIFAPVDVKPVAFVASEAGKKKPVHNATVTLTSLSGAKVELHYQGASKNFLEVRGYDKSGGLVEEGPSNWSNDDESKDIQINFKAPVSKVEAFVAAGMVERQFPFTLVRGALAGSPSPATVGAKPPATTPDVAVAALKPAQPAPAAGDPEAIYAKFHSAGLAANFNEMLKYGTAAQGAEGASMPPAARQEMLNFLAQMLPKSYSVASKTIGPDVNHATLLLTAPGAVAGTATLVKENGVWKVDKANWGGSSRTSEPPSSAATGGRKNIKSKPAMPPKVDESPAPPVAAIAVAAPEPHKKVITTKFNDVFTAVMYQDLAAVKELLDLGWWVDKPEPGGSTPLMATVNIGDTAIAELLLKYGANPNVFARGASPLGLAKRNHNAAMIALLQRYGATVE